MDDQLKKSLDLINSDEVQEQIAKDIKEKLKKEEKERQEFYDSAFHDTYDAIINEKEISFEQNQLFCDCIKKLLLKDNNELVSVVDIDNETTYYFYKKVKVVSIAGCSPMVTINENGELNKSEVIFKNDEFQIKKLTFILNGDNIEKEFLYSDEDYVFDSFSEYLFKNQLLSKAVT